MSEREQFEAWAKPRYAKNPHFWLRQIDDGGYSCGMADSAWDAWQAARAQPAQAVPVLTDADWPDIDDTAHSALQEALAFGLNHDVFYRYGHAVLAKAQLAAEQAVRAKMGAVVPMRERELECVIADLTAECKQLRGLLKNLIDIEGPQPGTATWAEEVREAIGIVGKEGA